MNLAIVITATKPFQINLFRLRAWSQSRFGRANAFPAARAAAGTCDHRDLHSIVHDKARNHRIGENRERLPPRQWHESRETHERQDGARERIRHEGRHEGLAGHRRPEPAALPRGHDGECGKVEQRQEAEGVEGIVVRRQSETRPADPQEEERLRDHRDAQHHGHVMKPPMFHVSGFLDGRT